MTWRTSTDQMGNKVVLAGPPQRIISLVPSQTELLYDLGLEDRVVGITKFCIHPAHWHKTKTIVGGTKNFQFDVIKQLRPDFIIGNKEENYFEGISTLQQHAPVWMSDVTEFEDAIRMINSISSITDCEMKGAEITQNIQLEFDVLKQVKRIKTLYLMWRNPWMGAANKTFIHSMMEKIGLVNVLDPYERYPELSLEILKDLNPEMVFLSTEPYPFSERHVSEILEILPKSFVRIVDGEMFSWYGSRLALAPVYFNSLKFGHLG